MTFNPITLRKAKTACNFGLSECNRVKIIKMECLCNDQIWVGSQTINVICLNTLKILKEMKFKTH